MISDHSVARANQVGILIFRITYCVTSYTFADAYSINKLVASIFVKSYLFFS